MTPEEIIKGKPYHSNWEQLKASNPEKYKSLSQQAVLEKLGLVLPYMEKWQLRIGGYNKYETLLPKIESALQSLDYTIYDKGLEGKKTLTDLFYTKCMFYEAKDIVRVSEQFDKDVELKIKNLVNRSFGKYYHNRVRIINNIVKFVDMEKCEAERISLLAYAPFHDYSIGVEWLSKRAAPTLIDLLDDWLILLCFDAKMFISEEFINELCYALNQETVQRLIEKLLIYIARQENNVPILIPARKKYKRRINKYREILRKGTIIEDICFKELTFGNRQVNFYGCTMPITPCLTDGQLRYLKSQINQQRNLVLLVYNTPIKGKFHFRPLFSEDMEYIRTEIKNARCNVALDVQEAKSNEYKHAPIGLQYEASLNIIAESVKASQLIIKSGVISYNAPDGERYYLRSVRVESEPSRKELERVTHTFTLVKDRNIINNEKKECRFIFYPANDLSFLLAEINRVKENKKYASNDKFPLTGEFELPWRYVSFYDGIMYLIHPNSSKRATYSPYKFRNPHIKKSYGDLSNYLGSRCPKFKVKAVDGAIVSLLNFEEFKKMIPHFNEWTSDYHIGIQYRNKSSCRQASNVEFYKQELVKIKSPYIDYLSSIQSSNHKIYYLLETAVHSSGVDETDEYGYLFTIKETDSITILLYENISDRSRSSLVFIVQRAFYYEAVESIRRFLSSNLENKRQKLAWGIYRFEESYIINIRRIAHTTLTDWMISVRHIR